MPHSSAELTRRGIAALRTGDRATARQLLTEALRADPSDAQAWLWLAGALPEPEAQRHCLQRALKLDPSLEAARQGLAALGAQPAAPTPPNVERSTPTAPTPNAPTPNVSTFTAPTSQRSTPQRSTPQRSTSQRSTPTAPTPPVYVNPWLGMWLRPRTALRSAIALRNPFETASLAALTGISAMLAWAAWGALGEDLSAIEIVLLAVVIGPILGLGALLMGGVLLRTGGQFLGGRAGASRVRAALAWASLPIIVGLPLWLIQAVVLPEASFGFIGTAPLIQGLLAAILGAIHLGLWLWSFGLSIIGLAEAHLMPTWRAAASWLIAVLIVVGALGMLFGGTAFVISLRGG